MISREEAIEYFVYCLTELKMDTKAIREAYELAISALSQPERPTEDSKECVIAGQCIEHKGELYIRLSDVEKCVNRFKKPEKPNGQWVKTSKEKPNSTRHIIYADGGLISHYGYYLQPKDKWYTNWKCEEEIPEPVMWREMPEVPKESILDECSC